MSTEKRFVGYAVRGVLSAAVAVLLFVGCEPPLEVDSGEDEVLPGTMQLVSREPVTPLPPPNLLSNGGFEEWVTGAPAPVHFVPPLDTRGFSAIEPETERVKSGKNAVRQTWVKPKDTVDWFYRLFHTAVEGLEPGTQYRVTFSACNLAEESCRVLAIQAWGPKPGAGEGNPEFKILGVCEVGPSQDYTDYTFTISPLPHEPVSVYLMTGSSTSSTTFPATAIWDDFSLRWDGGDPEAATAEGEEP
ncbi:MAG: hypothetical protein GY851_17725 [bacterium]|nr:hypothetical protein [bacterium]